MRDGNTLKDPMREVTIDRFTKFNNLPRGIVVGQDGLFIVECDEKEADAVMKQEEQKAKKQIETIEARKKATLAKRQSQIDEGKKAREAKIIAAQMAFDKKLEASKKAAKKPPKAKAKKG
jgi:hypothetical protein